MTDWLIQFDDRLERIEAKLDALILALAQDDEDDRPTHDMDGEPIPRPLEVSDTL